MPLDHRAALAEINRFDQLVAYLRDEMGWPIARDSFDDVDDLFYDFTPEELGIDTKNAAKIQEIKRLRPLSVNQPWGIFFVKFEPKRLPVVALRRILSQVSLKKRASANSAERAAWSADDLLFVSNYGEGESRQISFAHFSQNEAKKDLPTLKVLGWDNLDTPLHLDHVAELLTERLAWPDDEEDEEDWRRQWRSAFTLGHREPITTSKKLSVELAKLARNIRDRINTVLAIETENGPVTKLMGAFKEALVHDLDEDGFADMYAQTIAYGLLSARVENPAGGTADDFAAQMPATNPFLKELMETFLHVGGRNGRAGSGAGIDFDELGVGEVVELLDDANMEAVTRDFGDRNPQEDPVIHFYELFLKEYDAKKRMQRGVFYTPLPVVSFIVRSVDEFLRTEFGLEDGLADTTTWGEMAERFDDLEIPEGTTPDQAFVQILDPATGTGTFLVEVIDVIHKTMTEKWRAEGHSAKKIEQLWNDYVPKRLLPRLHGYELLMAPYAIAHMKIGLKLYETGYRFGSDARARIYLTNTLEPPQDISGRLAFMVPALAHEAAAVNDNKRNQRFTVVIGNPPYANFGQLNRIPWILKLLDDYKHGLEEQKLNLDDDFIKFVRYSQHLLSLAGCGVHGMITNNVYIDGITHRRMRQYLMEQFHTIFILDLHGSAKKSERCPDGSVDDNVFDIQQGVGISVLANPPGSQRICVRHSDLWGTRSRKYHYLGAGNALTSVDSTLNPNPPYYFFVPKCFEEADSWNAWEPICDAMPTYSTGVKTHLDKIYVGFADQEIRLAIEGFLEEQWHDIPLTQTERASPLRKAVLLKKSIQEQGDYQLTDYDYRAFDTRRVAYLRSAIEAGDHRYPVMRHVLNGSPALVTTRQLSRGGFSHVLVTRSVADMCLLSTATKECAYVFPLKLAGAHELFEAGRDSWNFSVRLHEYTDRMGIGQESVFHYSYAVLHSPGYRSRYAEFLKIDFPRLPLTGNLELFRSLAELGGELVALHLMETPKLNDRITALVGSGEFLVEKVSYSDETVWIDKAKKRGFRGVPEEVWNFHIGGYQVCEKWLKDRQAKGGKNPRPGRVLTDEDIAHYQKIVVALNETIRLMAEIDTMIEGHGGWPKAFASAVPNLPRS